MHEDAVALLTNASAPVVSDAIIASVHAQNRAKFLCVCSLCILVWDIIITLDQEVEYMWKSRPHITLIKTLFFLNRAWVPWAFVARIYRFFVAQPSLETCLNLGTFVLWSGPINIFVIETALAVRVWALYDQSRRVLYSLCFVVGGSVLSSLVVFGLGMKTVRAPASPANKEMLFTTGCNRVNAAPPPNFNSLFYCALVVEVILFLMTIRQVVRHGRSVTRAPLMTHIARTGTVFFFLAMFAILFALVGSFIPALNSAARTSNFIVAILSITCSRLILSIRDAFHAPLLSLHVTTDLDVPQFAPTGGISEVDVGDVESVMRASEGLDETSCESVGPRVPEEELRELEVVAEREGA